MRYTAGTCDVNWKQLSDQYGSIVQAANEYEVRTALSYLVKIAE